jgi:hypothetical protein
MRFKLIMVFTFINRRGFLGGVGAAILPKIPALAAMHGSASTSTPRVILPGYGQSNMRNFFANSDVNSPSPNANVFVWDGITLSTPPAGSLCVLLNGINNVTGLQVIAMNCAANGAALAGISKGTAQYTFLMNTVQSIIRPTDIVAIPFDQGEGDTNNSPHKYRHSYMDLLQQLIADISSHLGRTTSNCPLLVCGMGNARNLADGTLSGVLPLTWQLSSKALT